MAACDDCDRAGCDAITRMAAEGGSAVAGTVAQQSDVISDGCEERPLAAARLEIWTLEEPFERRSEPAALVAARPPDRVIEAMGTYRQSLPTGWYLFGVRPNGVELNVHEEATLTVNVLRRDGPTSFFVGRHGTGPLDEDFGYDIGC